MRAAHLAAVVLALGLGSGCSLITVQQEPFPPLAITADRPKAPPPRVVLTASSIQITEKIQFDTGKSEILPVSFGLLDEIVAVFKDNPQIEVVQIEGHTDNTGGDAINKKLAGERAASVRKYLMDKGIAGKRLVSKGFGPERPIGDNGTEEGREQNRRVEFNIVKQGPKKTVVQDE